MGEVWEVSASGQHDYGRLWELLLQPVPVTIIDFFTGTMRYGRP